MKSPKTLSIYFFCSGFDFIDDNVEVYFNVMHQPQAMQTGISP
jgi:hypothetical protein